MVLLAGRFVVVASLQVRAVRAAHRLAAELGPDGRELAVLDSRARQAVAIPGRPGRIAVTSGLLRALDPGQRRALLAHERSHLTHRHHVHLGLVRLATAVNPLLWRLPGSVAWSVERWADEDAATIASRPAVAAALTRAAGGARPVLSAAALDAAATDVADRLAALRMPAPRFTLARATLPIVLLIASAVAVAVALHDTERLFELAEAAYVTGRR